MSVQETVGYDIYKRSNTCSSRRTVWQHGVGGDPRRGLVQHTLQGRGQENVEFRLWKQAERPPRNQVPHQACLGTAFSTPRPFCNNILFEVTLAQASRVVRGSNHTKLTNVQLEYEMIRSETKRVACTRMAKSSLTTTWCAMRSCPQTL